MKKVCVLLDMSIWNDARVERSIQSMSKTVQVDLFCLKLPKDDTEKFSRFNENVRVFPIQKQESKKITLIKHSFFYREYSYFIAEVLKTGVKYDLIFSVHCKQLFPSDLVKSVKCINIHPGYNPINRGWYPQVFAILNDTPIGATIHEIDEKLDHGAIIVRSYVEKNNFDTSETLYNKIINKEIELFDLMLDSILNNSYVAFPIENEGNLHLKKDFNALLHLDLNEKTTMGDCIKKLRALTHGDFKNAYFLDSDTGKKIFVSLKLKPESNE